MGGCKRCQRTSRPIVSEDEAADQAKRDVQPHHGREAPLAHVRGRDVLPVGDEGWGDGGDGGEVAVIGGAGVGYDAFYVAARERLLSVIEGLSEEGRGFSRCGVRLLCGAAMLVHWVRGLRVIVYELCGC